MPAKKDGTAGTASDPVEPGTAVDADDAQSGGVEAARSEGMDHAPEKITLGSVSVDSEEDAPADDDSDSTVP